MALMVQCAACITVLILSFATHLGAAVFLHADFVTPVFVVVLMQSFWATLYCTWFRMASWWRWIHLFFPITVWVMFSWHIPSEIYLLGFAVCVSLYWTTFRTQVPFYPSRPIVWQQVTQLISEENPVRLIDIGSGLGDMSMHISRFRPNSHVEGIEIAPLPWFLSVVRAKIRRSSAVFKLGDYRALNFAHYDVIFAYLSPAAMLVLWEKAQHEMQTGSLLISLEFQIPGVPPTLCIEPNEKSAKLYVWKIA